MSEVLQPAVVQGPQTRLYGASRKSGAEWPLHRRAEVVGATASVAADYASEGRGARPNIVGQDEGNSAEGETGVGVTLQLAALGQSKPLR